MGRSKLLLIGVVLVLCALSASAFNFGVKISPESQSILKDQLATFNITIHHDSDKTETFSIYSPDVQWDVPNKVIDIPAGGSGTVELAIKQYEVALNPGYYLINIHVRPNSQDTVMKTAALVSLRGEGSQQYLPVVRLKPSMPAIVDPRESGVMSVDITNLNSLQIDDMTIKVRSNLISTDMKATLKGLATQTIKIPINLNANALRQEDQVYVNAFVTINNKTYRFDSEPITYDVMEYGEIAADVQEKGGWFSGTKTITFTNTGNADKSQTYRIKKPFFTGWFMSTEPAGRIEHDGEGGWFAWDIVLPVGTTTKVAVTTDWTPLVVIILTLVIAYLIYYFTRSPVIVEKNAVVIGTKEGGLTDIKVLIEVRNRSRYVLKNVKLLDKIPRIVDLVEEHGVGTLRPAKVIRHDQSGSLLSWHLNELDRYEERVVSYRIRTKLSIVGRLHLPVAIAKFERRAGRVRSTKSNISQIGFGQ